MMPRFPSVMTNASSVGAISPIGPSLSNPLSKPAALAAAINVDSCSCAAADSRIVCSPVHRFSARAAIIMKLMVRNAMQVYTALSNASEHDYSRDVPTFSMQPSDTPTNERTVMLLIFCTLPVSEDSETF